MMKPTPWARIAGGRAPFERAFEQVLPEVQRMQGRFATSLDLIGPPGVARWSPCTGEVTLRGRAFRAELLGSFDGQSWLWSWANPAIPDEHTNFARGLCSVAEELGIAALATPMIADTDEALPGMFGALAIGLGFGDAMWIANACEVYVLLPGQFDDAERVAVCFSDPPRTLAEVLEHVNGEVELVADDDALATVRGSGYEVRLRRIVDEEGVLREAGALPREDKPQLEIAYVASTVFVVESVLTAEYDEAAFTPFGDTSDPCWAPAGLTLGVVGVPTPSLGRAPIPWQALTVCEQLNRLADVALYDVRLRSWYPRA